VTPEVQPPRNAEGEGVSIGAAEGDDAEEHIGIGTSKPVERLLGNTVWLIAAEGKPRRYYLTHRFVVDEIGSHEEGACFANGIQGALFRPRIALNDRPWFKKSLKSQSNFSLGVQPIKQEFVVPLEKLAGVTAPGPGQTNLPGAGQ
jgi:hypothetical protein